MSVAGWDRVQELFAEALEQPEHDRDGWLRRACADDAALYAEVASLLQSDADAAAFLHTPAALGKAAAAVLGDTLAPGDRIDDYEIEALVGSGGFGAVYRARHTVIGKRAAIKILHHEHASSSALTRRFVDEARAVNEIGHPNIIDVFGFGETPDGRLFFTMEYVDAPSLEELIAEKGRLPLHEALPILRGLAAALDAAHDRDIVHRDLKPANVLVGRDADGRWTPKLLDFGIAKLVREDDEPGLRTQTGQLMGTPAYMAPEQIRGLPVDGRTDAYALGVLAFRMLTGRLPFAAATSFDTLVQHTQQDAPAPSSVHRDLSPEVDAFVLGLLAKDPDARPARLGPAVAALEDGAVAARPVARSSRTVAAAAVLGVLALLAIWGWSRRSPQGDAERPPAAITDAPPPAATPTAAAAPAPDRASAQAGAATMSAASTGLAVDTESTPERSSEPASASPTPKTKTRTRRRLNDDLETPFGR